MNLLNKTKLMCAAVLITAGMTASAGLQMRLTSGATIITVIDQGAGDLSPNVGQILFVGEVGPVFTFNVHAGVSKPVLGDAANPHLDLQATAFTFDGGGLSTLTVELT